MVLEAVLEDALDATSVMRRQELMAGRTKMLNEEVFPDQMVKPAMLLQAEVLTRCLPVERARVCSGLISVLCVPPAEPVELVKAAVQPVPPYPTFP